MASRLALATYLAADYDEAIDWFRAALDWVVVEDAELGEGKRWVRVATFADTERACSLPAPRAVKYTMSDGPPAAA